MWGPVAFSDVWMEIEIMSLKNNFKTSLDTSSLRLGFWKLCCVRQILLLWSWRFIKIAASQSSEDGWTLWRPALDWRIWTSWSCLSFQTVRRIGQGAHLVIKCENDSPGPIPSSLMWRTSFPEWGEGLDLALCGLWPHRVVLWITQGGYKPSCFVQAAYK